jgi:hypothetical protein
MTQSAHEVYWTYATQPGSDDEGYLYWRLTEDVDYFTLPTACCGEAGTEVDSGGARVIIEGDLHGILNDLGTSDYLHSVFHQETDAEYWGVFYTSRRSVFTSFDVYMPLVLRRSTRGTEG